MEPKGRILAFGPKRELFEFQQTFFRDLQPFSGSRVLYVETTMKIASVKYYQFSKKGAAALLRS
jgi:hypothetical protein